MRKILTLGALLSCSVLFAQVEEVYDSHPAGNGEKLLTVKDITLNSSISPAAFGAQWQDENNFLYYSEGSWMASDIEGNEHRHNTERRRTGTQPEFPEGASDITRSPEGAVAYTLGHSLYLRDADGNDRCIAEGDGQVTYGQTVSRNEFGIGEGIYWSDSGSKLAFYSKDESRVTDFPLLDIATRTGELLSIKYPMNGMDSELVSLGVFDLESGRTVWVAADDFTEERYLTNISWSPDDRYIFIQVLDRSQHHMHLNMYRSSDGSFVRTLLTEDNDAWVEPLDHIHFLKGTAHFIYRTDNRDGFRNLYLCDTLGGVRRLTAVDADVQYVGNDGTSVFYTSAEVSPVENHLFRIDIRQDKRGRLSKDKFSAPVRLTSERGWHSVTPSPDFKHFIDSYSSFNTPRVATLRSCKDGKVLRTLLEAEDPLKDYKTGEVMLGTVKSADGLYDNWYRLFLPPDFDPSKQYPVMLYVYGGPHSQMVTDRWLGQVRLLELLMAQKGYIVYVQDNRGTQNRGAAYEKAINRQCGQAEMADQMVGVKRLMDLPFVDKDRIGVHGWSYGGFMTISLMTNYPDVFKVGVAGGPVIDWKWYEIMYGERYMDNPETNPEGFEKTSLIGKAESLKGKLLICQGAIDNTVVWEHSLSFVQKCIENDIQLDYFPYPRSEHNVAGTWRVHLNQKIVNYFEDYL